MPSPPIRRAPGAVLARGLHGINRDGDAATQWTHDRSGDHDEPERRPARRRSASAGRRRRSVGRPAVVLCHGMESTKEGTKHQALAARLVVRGYVCLRFDFSYVGESGGRFADLTISGEVDDLGGAVDFLTARGSDDVRRGRVEPRGHRRGALCGQRSTGPGHGDDRGGRIAARHHRANGADRARGLAAERSPRRKRRSSSAVASSTTSNGSTCSARRDR